MEEKENKITPIKLNQLFPKEKNPIIKTKLSILTDITDKLTNVGIKTHLCKKFESNKNETYESSNCCEINSSKSKKSKTLEKELLIRTLNFMNILKEIYAMKLKKTFSKIKENAKSAKASKMFLMPIFQKINCLKKHYEKKILLFAFSQMKSFCFKSIFIQKEILTKKKSGLNKFDKIIENKIKNYLLNSFRQLKKNFNSQKRIKYKRVSMLNFQHIMKKIAEMPLKIAFKTIYDFNKKKMEEKKSVEKSLNIFYGFFLSRKQFSFNKIQNFTIKQKYMQEVNKNVVLSMIKIFWNRKKEIYILIRKYSNFMKITEKNSSFMHREIQTNNINFAKKIVLKFFVDKCQNFIFESKKFAFKKFENFLQETKKNFDTRNQIEKIKLLSFAIFSNVLEKIYKKQTSSVLKYFI